MSSKSGGRKDDFPTLVERLEMNKEKRRDFRNGRIEALHRLEDVLAKFHNKVEELT